MTKEPRMPLPIERVGDVQAHYFHPEWNGTPELETWLHAEMQKDRFIETAESRSAVDDQILSGIAFWSDVAKVIYPYAAAESPTYIENDHRNGSNYRQQRIDRVIEAVAGAEWLSSLVERRNFINEELIGITEAHFAAVEAYLTTGNPRKSFWSEHVAYAQTQVGDWDQAKDLETLLFAANHLDSEADGTEYGKRINIVAKNLGILHATHGNLGRAIGLLSILDEPDERMPLLHSVVDAMLLEKEKYGDAQYQSLYDYAQTMLRGKEDTMALFTELLLPQDLPPTEGAVVRVRDLGSGITSRSETWAETRSISAVAKSTKIQLPFTGFLKRGRITYPSGRGSTFNEHQYNVDYDDLDPELRKDVMIKLAELKSLEKGAEQEIDSEPLERIGFGFGFTLRTQDVSSGEWKILPQLDPELLLDDQHNAGELDQIEEVGEADWLVTKYDGSYLQMEVSSHRDIAAIAPEGANAFWIAGNPRIVNMPGGLGQVDLERVVVTPITFYRTIKVVDF